jgi:ABC-type arginine/histidine transport system permease subunit
MGVAMVIYLFSLSLNISLFIELVIKQIEKEKRKHGECSIKDYVESNIETICVLTILSIIPIINTVIALFLVINYIQDNKTIKKNIVSFYVIFIEKIINLRKKG